MAKEFYTNGIGSAQTLNPSDESKIPIYDSLADVEDDLANLSENQIVATKDKAVGELLHTVDIVEAGNMNPVTSNAVAGSKSYSTTEHLTGAKWIDGKPIYQKVLDVGVLPNNTGKDVLHYVQNLGDIIDAKLIAKTAEGIGLVCNYGGSLSIYADKVNVHITSAANFSGYNGYAIIEYTKTTD